MKVDRVRVVKRGERNWAIVHQGLSHLSRKTKTGAVKKAKSLYGPMTQVDVQVDGQVVEQF